MMTIFYVFTLYSKGLFSRFGRTYCPDLHGDSVVQVHAEVTGKKECVGYAGMFEEILAS
jgi:hypothetical protein